MVLTRLVITRSISMMEVLRDPPFVNEAQITSVCKWFSKHGEFNILSLWVAHLKLGAQPTSRACSKRTCNEHWPLSQSMDTK